MIYDYNRLVGRIIEVYGTRQKFSEAMEISQKTLTEKIKGTRPWKQSQIEKASNLLHIPNREIHEYFFTQKVQ